MSSHKLCCYIKGDTCPFFVNAPPTLPMGQLRNMIKDVRSNDLRGVDAKNLSLSKINVAYNTVEAEITSGKYQPDDQQPLPRKDIMSLVPDVWPEPPLFGNLHIYVSLPDMGSPILNVDDRPVDMNFVRDYENVFIKVKEWGRFDDSNIERNGLHSHRCGTQPPEFVAEFERKLVSKPCVAADAYQVYRHIDHPFLDKYFRPVVIPVEGQSPVESAVENESHRHAGYLEVLHLASIAAYDWKQYWQGGLGKSLNERIMNVISLSHFAVQPTETTTVLPSSDSWPFKLIMQRESSRDEEEKLRLFEPRSDLLMLKSGLPRLLVEVNSRPKKKWPEDLIRMLLLGSAVVRFANNFSREFMENKDFVLFTTYIWDHGAIDVVGNSPRNGFHCGLHLARA